MDITLTITRKTYYGSYRGIDPYDVYVDNKEYKEFLVQQKLFFDNLYLDTVIGGRCAILVSDANNGKLVLHSDMIQIMKEIGWLPMATIIIENSERKISWGTYLSPSNPSFPQPIEYLLLFSKQQYKLPNNNKKPTDLTKEEFISFTAKIWKLTNVWDEVVYRCVKLLTWPNDLIYIPINDMGTQQLIEKLNRKTNKENDNSN